MDHIWEANVSGTAPTFPAGLQVGYPTETPVPTVPGVWWYHQITEEIRNVIVAAGETPNADALNQLLNAINILAKNSPTINGSVTLANYTANSVPYINASNVLVTEAGFTFDGTTMVVPNVTAAGRVLVGNGNASAPSIGFSSDGATDTGFFWGGDGFIGITNNGVHTGTFAPGGALSMIGDISAPNFHGNLNGNADTATNVAYSGLTGSVPTWNQNTTGSAGSLNEASTLPNGTTAVTQSLFTFNDEVATNNYVQNAIGNYRGVPQYASTAQQPQTDFGCYIEVNGTFQLNLPSFSGIVRGATLTYWNFGTGTVTLQSPGPNIQGGPIVIPSTSFSLTTGQTVTLIYDGTSLNVYSVLGGGTSSTAPHGSILITSTEIWTIPAGVYSLRVDLVGGGGGGGGGYYFAQTDYSGAPGGAGGQAVNYLNSLTPGDTISVTIGAGGSAGPHNGGAGTGGTTSISSGTQTVPTIDAYGGTGGYGDNYFGDNTLSPGVQGGESGGISGVTAAITGYGIAGAAGYGPGGGTDGSSGAVLFTW